MWRRLFERFQQCVECLLSEHVHLVDDVDLETGLRRRVAHVVAQLAHVINAAVTRAIDLDYVEAVARGDLSAVIAYSAWRDRDRKSTRLNSSHEWISYAVFCLKKKKV